MEHEYYSASNPTPAPSKSTIGARLAAAAEQRRKVIAGLLSVVAEEHADDVLGSEWLKHVRARLPVQIFLPCRECRKGGSRTLQVCIRTDLSMSVQCTNKGNEERDDEYGYEECEEYGYQTNYSAPNRDQQLELAEKGFEWLAHQLERAQQEQPPSLWLYVWIGKDKALTHGPASSTLKTLLRIYALVRKESRWMVAETREWIKERGWTPRGDVPYFHDGDPIPILLRADLATIAKQAGLSTKQVSKYLRMMVRLRLLRVAAREEHGQIVYQAGWWEYESHWTHPQARWFIQKPDNKSKKWKRRLQHVSSGQIRLQ